MENHTVKLRINIAVSLLALLAIAMEVRAMEVLEERRKDDYLQRQFKQLNEAYFNNSLPPTTLEWDDLTNADAMGQTFAYSDGTFVIKVDRRSHFLDDEELSDTIRHEVAT